MRPVSAVLCVVVAAGLSLTPASGRTAAGARGVVRPATLATVAGRVYAVAGSGRYVAWRGCDSVGVSDASGRRVTTIHVPESPGFGCQLLGAANYGLIDHDILAIIGGTVLWSKWGYGNSTDYTTFGAARITSRQNVRSVLPSNLWLGDQTGPAGSYIVGPVSDGREMLYGVTSVASDPSCTSDQLLNSTCPIRTRGAVWRVDGTLQRKRIAAAAATLIAFGGGRVAVVPHTVGQPPDLGVTGRLFRQPQPTVLLLRIAGGARTGVIDLDGEPYELAMSSGLGAALVGERTRNRGVRTNGPAKLEWFDPDGNGSAQGLAVAADAEALSVVGHRIVFREGPRILSYAPGETRLTVVALAQAGSSLIGPVLSGSKLLWADYDSASRVSRIRSLNISPR